MAMKELLRVTLNAKQVREACEAWAFDRTSLNAEDVTAAVEGIEHSHAVAVVFNKRRKARANGAAAEAQS